MKILITGGSGFIGRNLREQLGSSFTVLAPSHSELELLDEKAVLDYCALHKFDAVLHTAVWNSSRNTKKDPRLSLDHDIRMYDNLARASSHFGRLIHFGSGGAYSREHWIPKMNEEYLGKNIPSDDYGSAKYRIVLDILRRPNFFDLRIFAVFGKYEDWEVRFISNAICKTLHDLPITLRRNALYDYMHIDDLVKITSWFLEHTPSERAFNVCTGNPVALMDLAKMIQELSGCLIPIQLKETGMATQYSGDNSRLLKAMGQFEFTPLRKSIRDLIAWYNAKLPEIDRNKLLFDK